jgi:carbon storage regulator
MLILTRGRSQTVMIGDEVVVTVLDIMDDRVRIGIRAPRDVVIERPERLQRREESAPPPSRPR